MGLLRIRNLAVVAVMLVSSAAQQIRGNSPYLTQSGPPPLRFSVAMASMAAYTLPAPLLAHSAETNATEVAENKTIPSETNPSVLHAPLASSPTNGFPLSTDPE